MPNEIWGEIASFSSHNDLLSLRAASSALKYEADVAVTTIRLTGREQIQAFALANTFVHIRRINLYDVDNDTLCLLAKHLAAHPRPQLRIALMSRHGCVSEALGQLARLPLASLLVHRYHQAEDNGLTELRDCKYPVELTGNFTQGALLCAARLPTLCILYSNALGFDDQVAAAYAAHPALQYLVLYANPTLSSRGIADIAAMPALRDLVLYNVGEMKDPLNASAASALALSGTLENLYIETGSRCLEAPSFYALSASQTVKVLRISICNDLHHIGRMRRLQNVMLSGLGEAAPIVTLAAARAIASLPDLRFLTLRFARFEANALSLLLTESAATTVYMHGTPITPEALSSILSNPRISNLRLNDRQLSQKAFNALAHHPTFKTCIVNGVSLDRVRSRSYDTPQASVNHVF